SKENFFLLSAITSLFENLAKKQKTSFFPLIAIIGAGIGGTSSAYYLRQKFGKDVKIDLFERKEVGGRLATLTVEGQEYEAGGSVIHPLNLHMKRFVKDLGRTETFLPCLLSFTKKLVK
uniref:Protoporphyrinogen oxidase n=1 Tax=Spermophilus dauricus TaxID=99837 RepID=A0A8C9QEZ7_SPEDA